MIRKLIGYNEKNLLIWRKENQVDFKYFKEHISDEVFPMNQTQSLYIYGRMRDTVSSLEEAAKILENLFMKTLQI